MFSITTGFLSLQDSANCVDLRENIRIVFAVLLRDSAIFASNPPQSRHCEAFSFIFAIIPFLSLRGDLSPKQSIKTQNLQSDSNNFKSNAESLKDSSDFTNSSDLKNYKMDCHEVVPTSRNDGFSFVFASECNERSNPYLQIIRSVGLQRGLTPLAIAFGLPRQAFGLSRNDEFRAIPRKNIDSAESRNNIAMTILFFPTVFARR